MVSLKLNNNSLSFSNKIMTPATSSFINLKSVRLKPTFSIKSANKFFCDTSNFIISTNYNTIIDYT